MKKTMLLLLSSIFVSTYAAQAPVGQSLPLSDTEEIIKADEQVKLVSYILNLPDIGIEPKSDRFEDKVEAVKTFLKEGKLTSGFFYEQLPGHPNVAFGCYMTPAFQQVEWKLAKDKKLETGQAQMLWELLLK